MGKSICNLYRYAEMARASNHRYLCSLQNVIPVKSAQKEIQQVCTVKTENVKAYTGFNVWEKETMRMFRIISDVKYLLTGFTNKAMCRQIYPQSFCDKRNRGRITRLLKKLRVHGLIRKVPHLRRYILHAMKICSKVSARKHISRNRTYRTVNLTGVQYNVSDKGRRIMNSLIEMYETYCPSAVSVQ